MARAAPRERQVLAQRIASAAVGVPLVLGLIFIGGIPYVAVVAVALAVASVEFNRAHRGRIDAPGVLAALLVAGIAAGAHVNRAFWSAWMAGALLLAALAALVAPRDDDADAATDAVWLAASVAYVGFLGSFFVLLRDIDDGRSWTYLAVLATFATDTGAFFVGRAIGRRPLAPRISPKKTIEGFVGGLAAGYAAVVVLHLAFDLDGNAAAVAVLALLLPLAATLGDLVESGMKRAMRIKDASHLIPGHGGVLDRLDSILFTATLTYLFVEFVIR
jgi:phosphatidate cytidylyltransferase